MVQFYCDTGYVKVPDTEIAICQVTGSWSKTVPACLMPGCQVSRKYFCNLSNIFRKYKKVNGVSSKSSCHPHTWGNRN